MHRSFQRSLDPFRVRWAAGKGTIGRILRVAADLLKRCRFGPPLLVLVLWAVPAAVVMSLAASQLQAAGAGSGAYQALGSMSAMQTSWAELGTSMLDILRNVLFTPLMLYALARVMLGELSRRRPSPVQAVKEAVYDWRRALWIAVLLLVGMRLLNYLPLLISYVLGLLVAFLTAFLSWVPGLVAVLEGTATVLMVLLQTFTSFFGLCASFCIWMAVDQRELRGMAAVLEGIHMLRERIGTLGRLYLACFLLYLLGAEGTWLLYGWVGAGVPWLVPAVISPLVEGVALLLMAAGSAQLCFGGDSAGSGTVQEHAGPKDISHMKSANMGDE